MTIKEIIKKYLEISSLDGLYNAGICCCKKTELMCCEEPRPDCASGKILDCKKCNDYDLKNKKCLADYDFCIGDKL